MSFSARPFSKQFTWCKWCGQAFTDAGTGAVAGNFTSSPPLLPSPPPKYEYRYFMNSFRLLEDKQRLCSLLWCPVVQGCRLPVSQRSRSVESGEAPLNMNG
ncbi:hypothetical protein CYMTET_5683 [Cymbomonas tetramitiformis]|uniref:Uncharacterized protein n=1 Tax=Cymbomonas tetramitiformis TaxID=36881 RepID=A0AAE0GZ45_9CHLO|nr:hypothetical protein CYMTET_5683 [Cymbomonas tetramitiformis]